MSAFPRVLFVTPHAFNRTTGGGITYSNLFHGWPKASLATVHNDSVPTTADVCDQYFVLGPEEIDLIPPFDYLKRRSRSEITVASMTASASSRNRVSAALWLKGMTFRLLGESLPERANLTSSLANWIEAYRPQVLYTILGSNGMMSLVDQIRRRFRLPLVVHIMDDWVEASHRKGFLDPWQRWRMQKWMHHMFSVAETCMGISPAMCAEYSVRYGRKLESFQNTVDVSRWSHLAKQNLVPGSPADILYVGSIFPNAQLESLVDCSRAVAGLNAQGIAARLTIVMPQEQAARYSSRLAIDPSIRIERPIADDTRFFERISAADVLLLPVNYDDESIRFIRYSMPTKVPAYLAVGTPILAYGPPTTAQIDYAIRDKWALVVERRDPGLLADGLRRILGDRVLRERLSCAALATAKANHDAGTVRLAFQDALRAAARH